MKKTCSWLLALAGLLGLAGTTQAGTLPLIPLCLPELFGQEIPAAASRSAETPHDAEAFGDWLADNLELLMEYAPEARMVVQSLRPATPYHIVAAAILEYLTAVDAAHQTPDTVAVPPCAKDGACKACAPRPCAETYACPLAYDTVTFEYHVARHGGAAACAKAAGCCQPCCKAQCESRTYSCAKTGGCCTALPIDLTNVADACDNDGGCCAVVAQTCAVAKACKCCEDCKDCKNCTCTKSGANSVGHVTGPVVVMERCIEVPACAPPVAMRPVPPPAPYTPLAFGLPSPLPHPLMPPLPPSPLDELRELHMQRQMIMAAIEQVEQELARIEMQKHIVLAPVAHNAQKVHLVTEQFEAHCDALCCVNGDPHRVVLTGDVHLTCKKCGQSVHIEAPRVVVNMKDGTFAVESPAPSAVHCMPAVPPVMLWTPNMHYLREPATPPAESLRAIQWNVPTMPVPTNYYPAVPAETLPMPCPVGPARPAQRIDYGDK